MRVIKVVIIAEKIHVAKLRKHYCLNNNIHTHKAVRTATVVRVLPLQTRTIVLARRVCAVIQLATTLASPAFMYKPKLMFLL